MAKLFPKQFEFYPRTWVLPYEYNDLRSEFEEGESKTFIFKPEASQ